MSHETKIELPADIREQIDRWILRYPADQKRSGVFEALRLVQEHNKGFLTVELMNAVADHLQMPRINVYEVASFYSMYQLEPAGRYEVGVCTNISCALNGAEKMLDCFKKKLGIDVNETTPDGKVTLREVECLGACVAPPVCMIGKKYYENLSPEKIDEIVQTLK